MFVVSSDFCHWGRRFGYQPRGGGGAGGSGDPERTCMAAACDHGGAIHRCIAALDREGMRCVEAKDGAAFRAYLARTRNTICGRRPIGLLLETMRQVEAGDAAAAQQQQQQQGQGQGQGGGGGAAPAPHRFSVGFVRYARSSLVLGERDSSVSYASALVI